MITIFKQLLKNILKHFFFLSYSRENIVHNILLQYENMIIDAEKLEAKSKKKRGRMNIFMIF